MILTKTTDLKSVSYWGLLISSLESPCNDNTQTHAHTHTHARTLARSHARTLNTESTSADADTCVF